jgi:hypothetical protein
MAAAATLAHWFSDDVEKVGELMTNSNKDRSTIPCEYVLKKEMGMYVDSACK